MKKLFFTSFIIILGVMCKGQPTVNLDSCYAKARLQYPLIKQKELIEKTKEYNLSNAEKGYLPQVSFNGQATHQSDVTAIPISFHIPGANFSIPTISKDQFNVHSEIDQTIYDGGVIKQQKAAHEASAGIQNENIEVQLYALRDRMNQIYFGTLLIDEQLKQNKLTQKDLQNSIDKMQAAVNNGTVLNSNLYELRAAFLLQKQNEISLLASRKAYLDMLSLFINQQLNENTILETPNSLLVISDTIHRPELNAFDFQKKNDNVQEKMLEATIRPKFLYFFQGGYALPGLNGFNIDPAWYYITGVRLSWSIGGLYTLHNQKQLIDIDRQTIDIQKETFLFNTNLSLKQESAEFLKLKQLINIDNDIIAQRTAVKEVSKAQLDNGVITVHDYLSELDAEDAAKQNLLIHKVQLLMDEYNYKNIAGN